MARRKNLWYPADILREYQRRQWKKSLLAQQQQITLDLAAADAPAIADEFLLLADKAKSALADGEALHVELIALIELSGEEEKT